MWNRLVRDTKSDLPIWNLLETLMDVRTATLPIGLLVLDECFTCGWGACSGGGSAGT